MNLLWHLVVILVLTGLAGLGGVGLRCSVLTLARGALVGLRRRDLACGTLIGGTRLIGR